MRPHLVPPSSCPSSTKHSLLVSLKRVASGRVSDLGLIAALEDSRLVAAKVAWVCAQGEVDRVRWADKVFSPAGGTLVAGSKDTFVAHRK